MGINYFPSHFIYYITKCTCQTHDISGKSDRHNLLKAPIALCFLVYQVLKAKKIASLEILV